MRTGLPLAQAISIISANCVSRLDPPPTVPGVGSGAGAARMPLRQCWAVKMEITDKWPGAAERIEPIADVRDRGGGLGGIDRDAHQLRARGRELRALARGPRDVGGVSIGHRLHHD